MPAAPRGPAVSFKCGDFIVCSFPFNEAPDQPGPQEHYGLCLGTMTAPVGRVAIVAAYTTSQPWPPNTPLPRGVHRVSQERANRSGQRRSFVIDGRKIAFMPLTEAFFPHLGREGGGKVGHDDGLAERVIEDLAILSRSPGVVVHLGPLRPIRG